MIKLDVDDEEFILDLTLNKQLIPKGFFHRYQENGTHKVHRPSKEVRSHQYPQLQNCLYISFLFQEIDLCHYNGKVRDKPDSWVALSTCDGLSGVIFDGETMHYIEKDSRIVDGTLEDQHYLYKDSDLVDNNKTCGYAGIPGTEHKHENQFNRILRVRDLDDDHYGCPISNRSNEQNKLFR